MEKPIESSMAYKYLTQLIVKKFYGLMNKYGLFYNKSDMLNEINPKTRI